MVLYVERGHLQTPASWKQPVSSPTGISARAWWTEPVVHARMSFPINSSQVEALPKGAMRTWLPFSALRFVPGHAAHAGLCCDCVMSHLWAGGCHRWSVSPRLSSTLSSLCCCKQRYQEAHGTSISSKLLSQTKKKKKKGAKRTAWGSLHF